MNHLSPNKNWSGDPKWLPDQNFNSVRKAVQIKLTCTAALFSIFAKENATHDAKTGKEYSTQIPKTFHCNSNRIIYYMFNKENKTYSEELKMSNNNSSSKTDSFDKEYCESLNRLYNENIELTEIRWFFNRAYDWAYETEGLSPDVVLIGTAVPEEIVIASSAKPYWIIGGSLGSTAWSDDLVPRDTDPVSRSVYGYIKRPEGANFSDSLFVIPLVNDSMRKLAYDLKSAGRNICLIDVPPDRNDKNAAEKYTAQLKLMCEAVSEKTKVRATRSSIVSAMKTVSTARSTMRRFLRISKGRTDIITDTARQFVLNSYYMSPSPEEWAYHTECLIREIEYSISRTKKGSLAHPSVMLLGSPALFPNYKVPFLVSDCGLEISEAIDYLSMKSFVTYSRKALWGSCDRLIRNIASTWFRYDSSPAYVKNDAMFDYVSWLVQNEKIEGVIYHVLKGQIEYDFELERFEAMLSEYGVPVFRLETDYQYQDVEQLRIRLEAFSEMLTQRRCCEVKKAS